MTQHCTLGKAACTCGEGHPVKVLCPNWVQEPHSPSKAIGQSVANWLVKVAPADRRMLIDHLRKVVAESDKGAEALAKWKAQAEAGLEIGSDEIRFHFEVGMQVRNTLRKVWRDEMLPPIDYPDHESSRNWDDYYHGVLYEMVMTP